MDDDVLASVASDTGTFAFTAIDPITLAGTSELEAEMVAEIAAGTLQFGTPAWQLKEESDLDRDEVKRKALKFLNVVNSQLPNERQNAHVSLEEERCDAVHCTNSVAVTK